MAMHGGSTATGAYLIPNEMSRPETDRLDVKTVIESMKKLPPEQNKILVLEGAQVAADWRSGMLYNDFARRLQDLEPEIRNVKNLWVLSGCDVDQQCWSSEGLGQTVFSHYVIEALRGEAAGPDRRLTLTELHDYVFKKVRNWAWNARGAIQEPVLLPRESAGPGKTAGDPNRRTPASVHLASVEVAPTPEPPPATSRAALEEAWKHYEALDSLVPHPSVYSPRRWREYRAALVRKEELIRAGATAEQVGVIGGRLSALELALQSERFLLRLPESSQNNLVMSVVQGGVLDSRSAEPPEFLRFWSPPPDLAPARVWEELRANESTSGAEPSQPYRCGIDDFLIRRAASDSFNNLGIAASRLRQTRDNEYPQPAEAHYLIMLDKYLTPLRNQRHPGLWARVNRAIRLRRLAERTALGIADADSGYPRSEEVYPWIKPLVERADEARRLGEDQIFSTEDAAWSQADKNLASADQLYQAALSHASRVRSALITRDRVLANLPDYSRWLAHRHPDDLLKDDLSTTFGDLWTQVHLLAGQLEIPGDGAAVEALGQSEQAVAAGFEKVLQQFANQRNKFSQDRVREDCEVATAAAAVPFADTRLRTLIWDRLETIQDHDREVAAKAEPAEPPGEKKKEAVQLRYRRAQVQGLMALGALGRAWFDEPGFKDQVDFEQTKERILSPITETENEARAWWKPIAQAGDSIGLRWRSIAPEIDETLTGEDSRRAELRIVQDRFEKADRLGRLIDGGSPAVPDSKIEATGIYRQKRVHDLLIWLAERAWRDHWFDEDARAIKPYYRAAGLRFANDAGKLALKSSDPDAARMKDLLAQNDRLKIEGPARLILTSEPVKDVAYRIAAEGNEEKIPPGLPVIKPIVDANLGLEGESSGFRLAPWRTGGETVRFTVFSPMIRGAEKDPKLTRPRVILSKITVAGVFRGQHFSSVTDVELHPLPDQTAIGPPPPENTARVAVRADPEIIRNFGEGTGSIAIVLDCSGSMRAWTANGVSKFDEAKKALTLVLALIPPGTTVSLWTFSQIPKDDPGPFEGDPILLEPERTIKRLLEPARWNPDQIRNLKVQLDQIKPWLETPLVQAMSRAIDSDLKKAKGLKTLLVLTDGDDTRFMKNRVFNSKGVDIPTFIKSSFDQVGVRINMVFFNAVADPGELEKAKANFERTLPALNPPGSFVAAANLDQLVVSLKRGIRQKLAYQILKPDGTPVQEDPLDVSAPPNDADRWLSGLEAGIYKLHVVADQKYEHDIDLKKGDCLLVKLVPAGNGIGFERVLYSDDFGARVEEDLPEWRLAGLASPLEQRGNITRLQALSSLEKKPAQDDPQAAIRHVLPRRAWFKLDGQDIRSPAEAFAVRWRERRYYPSPVWHFDVPEWPRDPAGDGPARPILTAWWLSPDQEEPLPDHVFKTNPAQKHADFPITVRIDDDTSIAIESIGIETHRVEVGPDEWQDKSCLVVRLAYPQNMPYYIDSKELTGIENETVGYEHRFYSRANRYTGVFWPVNHDQFDKLKSLSLISLVKIRALAEKQRTSAVIKLPVPEPGPLPQPPP